MASDVRTTPRPWHALPDDLGALVSAAIPAIADELVDVLGPAIPVYRTLDGPFGRDVVKAVADALHDFAGVIEQRPPTVGADRALYFAVGERWFRSGHSLDELQAGYHLGARVVWRRIAAGANAGGRPRRAFPLPRRDRGRDRRGVRRRAGRGRRRGRAPPRAVVVAVGRRPGRRPA